MFNKTKSNKFIGSVESLNQIKELPKGYYNTSCIEDPHGRIVPVFKKVEVKEKYIVPSSGTHNELLKYVDLFFFSKLRLNSSLITHPATTSM